jgi:hypothetical protein
MTIISTDVREVQVQRVMWITPLSGVTRLRAHLKNERAARGQGGCEAQRLVVHSVGPMSFGHLCGFRRSGTSVLVVRE